MKSTFSSPTCLFSWNLQKLTPLTMQTSFESSICTLAKIFTMHKKLVETNRKTHFIPWILSCKKSALVLRLNRLSVCPTAFRLGANRAILTANAKFVPLWTSDFFSTIKRFCWHDPLLLWMSIGTDKFEGNFHSTMFLSKSGSRNVQRWD